MSFDLQTVDTSGDPGFPSNEPRSPSVQLGAWARLRVAGDCTTLEASWTGPRLAGPNCPWLQTGGWEGWRGLRGCGVPGSPRTLHNLQPGESAAPTRSDQRERERESQHWPAAHDSTHLEPQCRVPASPLLSSSVQGRGRSKLSPRSARSVPPNP